MPIQYDNLEDFARKLVVANIDHNELIRMLSDAYPDARYREILAAEIQRRALEKIEKSSRKIEVLTYAIVFLTVILSMLTAYLAYADYEKHF